MKHKHAQKHGHHKIKPTLHKTHNLLHNPWFEVAAWAVVLILCLVLSIIMSLVYSTGILLNLQTILGLVYVTFIPGYVFVKSFLKHYELVERFALSFGLSILIVIASLTTANIVFKLTMTLLTTFLIVLGAIAVILLAKLFEPQICKILRLKRKSFGGEHHV
jgi:uncharacterized membrane protein